MSKFDIQLHIKVEISIVSVDQILYNTVMQLEDTYMYGFLKNKISGSKSCDFNIHLFFLKKKKTIKAYLSNTDCLNWYIDVPVSYTIFISNFTWKKIEIILYSFIGTYFLTNDNHYGRSLFVTAGLIYPFVQMFSPDLIFYIFCS